MVLCSLVPKLQLGNAYNKQYKGMINAMDKINKSNKKVDLNNKQLSAFPKLKRQ